ncbi:TIGR02302 family protein [Martelella alba]|uniref:TIGR02302 family protein n=1 Tax=Martelella alba TaxID=2590451 RepID=A0A506UEP6_9HYPH|nr:TIGR02302 family protein [Martelella alba]TPW32158.1 TIGR02302 family protein [Martelella alba]
MADKPNETSARRDDLPEDLLRRVAIKRNRARLSLFIDALVPRLVWPVSLLFLFVAFSWFGLFAVLPFVLRLALLIVLAFGFVVSLYPLRLLKFPDLAAGNRRLEEKSGLSHQAISLLDDRPASPSPEALELWHAHRRRVAAKIHHLDSGAPAPDLTLLDPHGLRAIPVFLLFIGFFYASSNESGRIADAFAPPAPGRETLLALRVDAWISPPAYTGRAPVYLAPEGSAEAVSVPEGSVLTVRLSGEGADSQIRFVGKDGTAENPDDASAKASRLASSAAFNLTGDGKLEAAGRSWPVSVVADQPPVIAFAARPHRAANGALELEYTVSDDYAVTKAYAEITPADADTSGAIPLYPPPDFPLNLPRRNSEDNKAVTSRDITENPMSGSPVTITLVAEDAHGNIGRSRPVSTILPERNFHEMLAAAVAEQRRIFSLDMRAMPKAISYSEAMTLRPEETIPNITHFLLIKSAQTRMKLAHDRASYRDVADYMWQIATGIEDGSLSDAERRLRDAQDALSEALKNNASDAEIARLMEELRQAMQDYLSEMASRMKDMPQDQAVDPALQEMLRQNDLSNLLDQLENLARSGDRQAAQDLLSQLQRMMNNIQPPSSAEAQNAQQNSQLRQQVDKLGDLIQKQQQLMGETYTLEQQLQDRLEWGDLQDNDSEDGKGADSGQKAPQTMSADELREALKQLRERQDQLGEQLQALQKGLKDLGLPEQDGFGQAGEAMKGASEALGDGEGSQALDGQGKALQALRDGAQQMMNAMMANGNGQQGGQGGSMALGFGNQQGRDPLGRNPGSNGMDFGSSVKVPDEITVQRAREILDAIRRKLGSDAILPSEQPYLERLLQPDGTK